MIKLKKIFTIGLTTCLLTTTMPVFASTIPSKDTKSIESNYAKDKNISMVTLNKSKTEATLKTFVKNGSITQEYADKVNAIISANVLTNSANSETKMLSSSLYNSTSDMVIFYNPSTRMLTFNKEGWNAIKEVINIGGGTATIGFGVAALCGAAVSAPVAAIIGGMVVVANGAVNLQFALGHEYAYLGGL